MEFPEIKGKLGFGTLRLPIGEGGQVDTVLLSKMVDYYLDNGFNYFDTAHGYMSGKCEDSIRISLTSRKPRDSFILTDKLTCAYFNSEADIRRLFEKQLDACGVSYFDFYFLHAVTTKRYEKFVRCHAFEVIQELKAAGRIRHFGISFHDKPDFLASILEEHPEIEVVQLQFNYVDYDSPAIESKGNYDVCVKYDKPIFVMEPLKGGNLQRLTPAARQIFDDLSAKNGTSNSYASYAFRFVAGFSQIKVVLSGMNTMEQMEDNVSVLRTSTPLTEEEEDALHRVREIINSNQMIQCTGCRYCVDGCPKHILIPDLFACLNQKKIFNNWNQAYYYNNVLTSANGKASDCIKCGQCEAACPQSLPIRKLLPLVAGEFETTIHDMDKDSEEYKIAKWATDNRYTFLDKNHNFRPNAPVRRIDLVVFLWRIAGRPVLNQHRNIKDIAADYSFYDAVLWSLEKKIVTLDRNGNFNPQKHITKRDLIDCLWKNAMYRAPLDTPKSGQARLKERMKGLRWGIKMMLPDSNGRKQTGMSEKVDRITAFTYIFCYQNKGKNRE